MSASPAGATGTTPNGAVPPPRRRRQTAAALVLKQRAPRKPQPIQRQRPGPNGFAPTPVNPAAGPRSTPTPVSERTARANGGAPFVERPRSPTPTGEPTICPVVTTKRALLEGLRYHVARLQSKDAVDITNEEQFTRPIRLHRRDPRTHPNAEGMEIDSKEELLDEKERERLEAAKLERQRIREENAKLIAPAAPSKKKPQAFKKKVEQVYRTDETPEDRKRSQLRYEEALPWHLEDFDNKNIWQGAYEAALSECHVMLMEVGTQFQLVPLEKWYRFREKNKFKHFDIDQAEEQMGRKVKEPRWLLETQKETEKKKREEVAVQKLSGLFQRSGARDEREAKLEGHDISGEPDAAADADDIDFNYEEEFADDEENPIFEGDEDTQKQAEERIKRDQLAANVFGMQDEKEVDEAAEKEKKLAEISKQLQKGTRKALLKREKNYDYETDSEGNPYSSESESEDSDAERLKEEERKKEEEQKAQQKLKTKEKDDNPPSGASTKGTNTPSSRKEKHSEPLRKITAAGSNSSLKRPGSPNLSEASGNESSRKKMKKKHSSAQSGTATPKPGSPPAEGPPGLKDRSRQSSFVLAARGAGSGSDTEGTSSGRPGPKIKLRMSPGSTPRGSRASSPVASGAAANGGSRAASPPTGVPKPTSQPTGLPTAEEVLAAIPEEGVPIHALSKKFKSRVEGRFQDFMAIIRSVATMHKETRMVVRKAK